MSVKPLLSIVVPVFNERHNVAEIWRRVEAVLRDQDCVVELVLVDDGSTDGSWDAVAGLRDQIGGDATLRAVRFSRNFGKEAAILAGLREASGRAVVVMDGDLQHPPELIPEMLALWAGGKVDIVEAVKRQRQAESGTRRLAARAYYWLFRLACGMDLNNATDFKLLDRRVVDQYLQLPEVGRFFRGLTAWLGLRSVAVAFSPPVRRHGARSWSLGRLFGLARSSIISFSSLPLRVVTWFGILGVLFSAGLGAHTLWLHWRGLSEEGFPTVIILILGMGSMILLGIGLIGEYLAEIYAEVKRRPAYVVAETLRDD